MLGFFVAFAVKLPIVPLHGWLPDAHSQAPTAGSVDLAGLLLKTAAYGLLRFGLPFFPNASEAFAPIAMWLGIAGIFYGAVLAFAQTDIKRLVAYTSISHMGYVLIGIYAGSEMALKGAVVQMIAHGLSASALFILCGQLYERLHTRDMREMGGLWARLPWLPPLALFFAAASLGLPGTGNFVGEFLILAGSFAAAPLVVVLATAGLVLASAYSLIMVHRSMFGPSRSDAPIAAASDARGPDAAQPAWPPSWPSASIPSRCSTSPSVRSRWCSSSTHRHRAKPEPPRHDDRIHRAARALAAARHRGDRGRRDAVDRLAPPPLPERHAHRGGPQRWRCWRPSSPTSRYPASWPSPSCWCTTAIRCSAPPRCWCPRSAARRSRTPTSRA